MNDIVTNKKSFPFGKIIIWIMLIAVAVIQIFPLIWLLDFSVATSNEMFTNGLLIIPKVIHFDNYVKAFVDGHFLLYLKNSLLINSLAVILVLIISVMTAFATTRMHWKLSGTVRIIILLGMMIPIHATLLPNYVIYDRLRMTDTIWALLIPYVAFSLPQGLFLTSGFMESIPKEIEEAAVMDGCKMRTVFWRMIFPLSKSSIATISIFNFVAAWNELMFALIFMSDPNKMTLPVSLTRFQGQYSTSWAIQLAAVVIMVIPSLIVYFFLNDKIIKSLTIGAVKG
jgi:raffinose/stachyose/melibiose transport system permease protein